MPSRVASTILEWCPTYESALLAADMINRYRAEAVVENTPPRRDAVNPPKKQRAKREPSHGPRIRRSSRVRAIEAARDQGWKSGTIVTCNRWATPRVVRLVDGQAVWFRDSSSPAMTVPGDVEVVT